MLVTVSGNISKMLEVITSVILVRIADIFLGAVLKIPGSYFFFFSYFFLNAYSLSIKIWRVFDKNMLISRHHLLTIIIKRTK